MMSERIKTIKEKLCDEIPRAREVIYRVGDKTPLEQITLNGGHEYNLFIKREDLGPIKAYKWRGAFNAVFNHHQNTGCDTVVAASAGNHAQGVALAAKTLQIQAKIFMPLAAPLMKQKAVQFHGGEYVELILTGDTYNEAGEAAKKYVAETGYTYIHPFDDIYTMAGQAMIADEVMAQMDKDTPLDYAFLQIGGGGMAGAVATWLKQHYPNIKIIGVEGEDQASMKASVAAGAPITLPQVDSFCDGTAVTRPGDITFEICREAIDEFVTVSNEEVSAAIQQLWDAKRIIPEPSGAMGIAGLQNYAESHADAMAGKNVLAIICGANMDFSKLGLIAGKAAVGAHKRRYYSIRLPEKAGALLSILEAHFKNLNVSEFMYGKIHDSEAWQTIAIDAKTDEFETLEKSLTQDKIEFHDISLDADIRYKIINYNPTLFRDPVFMNVQFPERKGALRDFLRQISNVASICYFNYAYTGEVIGRALMGFEFSDSAQKDEFLKIIEHSPVACQLLDDATTKRILKH